MIMAQTRMAVRHHQTSRRLPRRRREPAAEKRATKSRNRTRKHAEGWVIFKMSKRFNFSVLPAQARNLRRQGLSVSQIAGRLAADEQAVRRWIGTSARTRRADNRSKAPGLDAASLMFLHVACFG